MEKKISKKTEPEKREGRQLDVKKRDRGDVKKQENSKSKASEGAAIRVFRKTLSDRGDVVLRAPMNNKLDKVTNERIKKVNETKHRPQNVLNPKLNTANRTERAKPKDVKVDLKLNLDDDKSKLNTMTGDGSWRSKMEAKDTVKLVDVKNDKLNMKLRNFATQNAVAEVHKNVAASDYRSDRSRNEASVKSDSKAKLPDPSNKSDSMKTDVASHKKETGRKPTIRTVRCKNDDRIYKAVTFTDQKFVKTTALEINIPNTQVKKSKIPKLIDKPAENKAKPTASNVSVKETAKPNRRHRLSGRYKRKRLNRAVPSPDKFRRVESPPTEVAKWAPCCINRHTKPYYEAWVNTTLAAISKVSKKDKLFLEKQNLIKTFQRSLERADSPELVHEDFADETYTGKIKVTQKTRNAAKRNIQHPIIGPLLEHFDL